MPASNFEWVVVVMNASINGLISLYAAIFLLAGNGYFAKGISIDVLDITVYRSILAAVALFLFLSIKREKIRLVSPLHYPLSIGLGLLLGIHWVTFFYSMRISTVALGMTVLYTYPVITVFLEKLFFNKAIRLYDVVVAIAVLIGVGLMATAGDGLEGGNIEGVLFGLLSAFCFAARNVTQQRYMRGYPAYLTIFYQVIVVGVVFLPFVDVSAAELLEEPSGDALKLLLLGVFFTALPHSLLANSLRTISAKSVALIGCLQPVIGTAIAFILIRDQPTAQVVVGAIIVLLGAVSETIRPQRVA
ncbi:DMT family transporter [Alkalimarinus alittae]|uniref:DMT family transporter n=1 Tax=Alkalimarinus alittae TaxID=2961619 RepID=A0ABY6MZ33_9ALTE|nr:DMT family transporter [Alkalimarinus alittae]UZE95017.1 DMT family transporter [Alkalimarinus alittae]